MQSEGILLTDVRHACAVVVSDEHRWELSARYIAEGLAAGEHVVYFEDGTIEQVATRLEDDGLCADAAIATGRLTIAQGESTRSLLSGPVAELEEAIAATVADAAALGFTAVRVTGEPGHALRRTGGIGPLQYEEAFRRALRRHPELRLLCLYDQQHYPPELLAELCAGHDRDLTGPSVYDDGLLRITHTGVGAVRLAGEADLSNRGVLDRVLVGVLDETLRSPAGTGRVTVDLASLRFLDVAGAMEFVRAADQFPSSHRLLLRGIRPRVHRVLERCGALFAPQLDLETRGDPIAPGPLALGRTPAADPAATVAPAVAGAPPGPRAEVSARRS